MGITYEYDVRPHLERALRYRRLREERWYALHKHDGRAIFWRITVLSLLIFWALAAYSAYLLI